LIFLLLHEVFIRQRWRPWITGTLLGGALGVQFFVSSEILAGTVLMGVIAVGGVVIVRRRDLLARSQYLVETISWCLATTAILLAYPLWFTLAGPQHINGVPASPAYLALYQADLTASVLPNMQWLSTPTLAGWVSGRWHILDSGELYLGIPLLATLSAFAIVFRRRRAILYAGAMALIAFVISLGATLTIDNRATALRLPFSVLLHIPLFQGILAARFSLFTDLFAAMMFAIGLDEIRHRVQFTESKRGVISGRSSVLKYVAAGVLVIIVGISLVPAHAFVSTPSDTPKFFTTSDIDAIPSGSIVLAYPYTDTAVNAASNFFEFTKGRDIMLYQAISNMRFKIVGGYGWFPAADGRNGSASPTALRPGSVQTLFDVGFTGIATPSQRAELRSENLKSDLRDYLRRYDIGSVIVLPGFRPPATVIADMTDIVGSPVRQGGVIAWIHVQDRLAHRSPPFEASIRQIAR
jgi:hypothetical protein